MKSPHPTKIEDLTVVFDNVFYFWYDQGDVITDEERYMMTDYNNILELQELKKILIAKNKQNPGPLIQTAIETLDQTISNLQKGNTHGLALEKTLGIARNAFANLIIRKAITLSSHERQVWEDFKTKEGNKVAKNGLLGYLATAFRGFRM